MIISLFYVNSGYSQTHTNNAFGDNMAVVDSSTVGSVTTYTFAMFSGDINQDGFIDVFDYPQYDSDNFNQLSGYLPTDLNGDGFVDVFDFPVYDKNNFNQVSIMRP